MVLGMNVITRSFGVGSLTLAVLASFANPANAQAFFPPTLSAARRSCLPEPVIRHFPAPSRAYIPGHYETVRERVRIPGSTYRVWVRARYRSHHRGFFRSHRHLVTPGHYETRRSRSRYEYQTRRVWVPGHYLD